MKGQNSGDTDSGANTREVLWTATEAREATGGTTPGTEPGTAGGDWRATGISIDTRSLEPGDLFVALKDQRDGHAFVATALKNGAAAALVSHIPEGVDPGAPLLLVPDVLAGLEAMARAARARFGGKLVAVTGSVGKTSTKEMLRTVLARQGRVHAAEKSFNNHWGVPITLARMPRDADFAVVEIGMNHPGEIAPLSRLARPHVALITTIAPAHLEGFADGIDGIAREKASICEGLEPGGAAVLPMGLPTSQRLVDAAEAVGAKVFRFGAGADADAKKSADAPQTPPQTPAQNGKISGAEADVALLEFRQSGDVSIARMGLVDGEVLMKIASPGRHFAFNGAGALAVVLALGGDVALAARDMEEWLPPEGRGRRCDICLDPARLEHTFTLIDDSYNANPASVRAGLEVLAQVAPRDGVGRQRLGRRIAILGDMLETGANARVLHAELAELETLGAVDIVHTVGPLMAEMWQRLPEDKRGICAPDAATLAGQVTHLVDAGDVVMVKGSLGAKTGQVAAALMRLDRTDK